MIKKAKIYFAGNVKGANRTQNLLSLFFQSNQYRVYINDLTSPKNFFSLLESIFLFPVNLYHIYRSDVLFVPAMNNHRIFELFFAKILGKKTIVDFYISYYDTYVLDRKKVSKKSISSYIYKRMDRFMLTSDKIIFLNNAEKKYYTGCVNKTPNQDQVEIIPLVIHKKERAKIPYFSKKNSDVFKICWWGTFIPLHGLDNIILAAKNLNEKNFDFELNLFGNSLELARPFLKMIKEHKLSHRVNLYDDYSFDNKKLPNFLKENCDLAFGAFGESKKAGVVAPNKVVESVAMGIPVLTCNSEGTKEFFDKESVFYSSIEPKLIANKVLEISSFKTGEITQRIENGLKIYNDNFSMKPFTEKIIDLFN